MVVTHFPSLILPVFCLLDIQRQFFGLEVEEREGGSQAEREGEGEGGSRCWVFEDGERGAARGGSGIGLGERDRLGLKRTAPQDGGEARGLGKVRRIPVQEYIGQPNEPYMPEIKPVSQSK